MSGSHIISVITPMGRERPELWARTAHSVARAASKVQPGWQVEWCIHADGVDPLLIHAQPWWASMQQYITFTESARSGFAGARNQALAAASGEVIGMCDDDDELGPEWPVLLSTLLATESAWVAGATVDVDLGGAALYAPPLAPGPQAPGEVCDQYLATRTWPWHCCAAVARTEVIRAAGGWDDLPWCEDISMWAEITGRFPGFQVESVVYLLRQHGERSTNTATRAAHVQAGTDAVLRRIAAHRGLSRP